MSKYSDFYDYIKENYNNKTSTELAKEIGCSRSLILKVWRENDLKGKDIGRSYYCDFSYFNNINCEDKAYIVGLLASDGCVYKRENHQGLWQITLNENDKDLLQDISFKINSDKPLMKNKTNYTLSINSDEMYNNLCNIGLFDKKTYDLDSKKLKIPKKYLKDYIRGYFDGDGSIFISKNKSNANITPNCFNISIVGFEENILSISKWLNDYDIKTSMSQDKRKYSGKFIDMRIHGTTNKYLFLKLIYNSIKENDLFMNRKYEKAKSFFKIVENNSSNRSENLKAINKYNFIKQNNGNTDKERLGGIGSTGK